MKRATAIPGKKATRCQPRKTGSTDPFIFRKRNLVATTFGLTLASLSALAAVTDFSGDFANANWTAGTQTFGCGSSTVNATVTTITLATANNCASIGANYTHTNGGGGATRAGTVSFSYSVTETAAHSYTANYGIVGGSFTTLTTNTPAAGSANLAVNVGEQIQFGVGKSAGFGITTLVISNFVYNFAPAAPTAAAAIAGNAQASVSWTAPADTGDGAITSYTATASPGGANCSTAATSCVVSGLTNGLSYTFTITATNAHGTSPASTASNAITPTAQPAPTVTSVQPNAGSLAGGTLVTITGTDFTGTTGVTFGGVAATGVTVVNATTITATTPAGTEGAKSVAVTTPSGTGTGVNLFTYLDLSNPANDPIVVGLVTAQAELSRLFIDATLQPIRDRLEQLRRQPSRRGQPGTKVDLQLEIESLVPVTRGLPIASMLNKAAGKLLPDDTAVWIRGTAATGRTKASADRSSQEIDRFGVAFGLDRRLDDRNLIGGAVFLGRSDTKIGSDGSRIDTDTVGVSLYGTHAIDPDLFLDAAIGVGYQSHDLLRVGSGTTGRGERTGQQVFGSVVLGKQARAAEFDLSPYLRGDLGYTRLAGYAEQGTGATLVYGDQDVLTAVTSAGLLVARRFDLGFATLAPHGRVALGLDLSPKSDAEMYYAATPDTVHRVSVDAPSSTFGQLGLGFDLTTRSDWTLGFDYERQQNGGEGHMNTVRLDAAYQASASTVYRLGLDSNGNTLPRLAGEIRFTESSEIAISAGTHWQPTDAGPDLGLFARVSVTF